MNNNNQRKGRNWRAKYLQRDEFWQWVANHFVHVKVKVDILLWLAGATFLAVMGIIIAKLIGG